MDARIHEHKSIPGYKIILRILGQRYRSGIRLTSTEELMAMSATAALHAAKFAPFSAAAEFRRPPLPEDVRGALADHAA